MTAFEKLLSKLPWKSGRQEGGYSNICLLRSKFLSCDAYLIYYPKGSRIPPHVDPVTEKRHYRLNIMLKRATKGGEFICQKPIFRWWRVFFFRPDESIHAVTRIEEGYRLMFSIGWAR